MAAARFGWRAVFLSLVPLVGVAALLALPRLLRERRAEGAAARAESPLRVLRDAELRAALATRACVVIAFFGVEAFLPLAYERVLGASKLQYGALLTLSALFWTAGAFAQARWNARLSPSAFARLGALALTLGIAFAAAALAGRVSIEAALAGWSLAGLGMGVAYQAATAAAMRTSVAGNEGATSAVLGITDALSISLATSLCGAFLAHAALAPGVTPNALLTGFALVTAAGLVSLATARRLPVAARG